MPRALSARAQRGRDAEDWVAAELTREGWSILARSWRGGGGELDLVCLRHKQLRIVEVKARDSVTRGVYSVGASKQARLASATEAFLAQRDLIYDEVAFLVAVVGPQPQRLIHWVEDAF